MNYEIGEIVLIDNQEYIILSIIEANFITYFYLKTASKPIKDLIVKLENNELVSVVDKEELRYVLSRFNTN